jgi:hypothetical protein
LWYDAGMGARVTDPDYSISVGDVVCHKAGDVRLTVIKISRDGWTAWCEIADGAQAGLLVLRSVPDLVKVGYLH